MSIPTQNKVFTFHYELIITPTGSPPPSCLVYLHFTMN